MGLLVRCPVQGGSGSEQHPPDRRRDGRGYDRARVHGLGRQAQLAPLGRLLEDAPDHSEAARQRHFAIELNQSREAGPFPDQHLKERGAVGLEKPAVDGVEQQPELRLKASLQLRQLRADRGKRAARRFTLSPERRAPPQSRAPVHQARGDRRPRPGSPG